MQSRKWIRIGLGMIFAVHATVMFAQTASRDSVAHASSSETFSEKISDGVITAKVRAALLNAKDVKDSHNIHVRTAAGVVRLTGTAPSREVKDAATAAARTVDGVTHVHNDLHVAN